MEKRQIQYQNCSTRIIHSRGASASGNPQVLLTCTIYSLCLIDFKIIIYISNFLTNVLVCLFFCVCVKNATLLSKTSFGGLVGSSHIPEKICHAADFRIAKTYYTVTSLKQRRQMAFFMNHLTNVFATRWPGCTEKRKSLKETVIWISHRGKKMPFELVEVLASQQCQSKE